MLELSSVFFDPGFYSCGIHHAREPIFKDICASVTFDNIYILQGFSKDSVNPKE